MGGDGSGRGKRLIRDSRTPSADLLMADVKGNACPSHGKSEGMGGENLGVISSSSDPSSFCCIRLESYVQDPM